MKINRYYYRLLKTSNLQTFAKILNEAKRGLSDYDFRKLLTRLEKKCKKQLS